MEIDERMTTKDKILTEGLRQLNENGLEKVSIRSIAEALEISPGNLTYHYKNIDVIVYELYLQLIGRVDEIVATLHETELSVPLFFDLTRVNYEALWDYRFLLLDFVAICRRDKDLRDHFRRLMAARRIEFRVVFDRMIQRGLMREEWVEGLYDRYILQCMIYSDAWVANAEIHFSGEVSKAIPFYADLFAGSILPYLSDEGLRQYREWRTAHPVPSSLRSVNE